MNILKEIAFSQGEKRKQSRSSGEYFQRRLKVINYEYMRHIGS